MSNYGAVALSEGMQGPTFSKLGSEISSARSADVTMGSSLSSGQGMLILFADMKESLIAIQKNTLQTTELLKTAIFGTPGQQTAEAVAGGETDDDSDDGDENNEKRPGILARTGASIKGAAKAFLGSTLGKLLLVGGVLTLLKLFGEKLVNPLANLIETIKRGDLSKKINELKEALKTTAIEAFEALKTKVEEMIQIVIDVKNKIVEYVDKLKLMFDPLLDYIDSFDVDGDGVLDAEERRNLKLSIQEKIKDFIYDTIGETLLAVGSVFGLVTAANIMTRIDKIPGKGAGLGLMGTAALVAMAAAGIYKLYNAVNFALDEALDKETGEMDHNQFVASLMAGRNPEGGFANAAINTFDKGMIGLSVGAIIGFLIGGPAGAIMGARIGAMAGSVIGAITGYAGSDEMKDTMDKMQSTIADSIDSITSTILGIPSKYDMDIERLTEEKKAVDAAIVTAKGAKYQDVNLIANLTKQSETLAQKIEDAPALIAEFQEYDLNKITNEIEKNEGKITKAIQNVEDGNLFPTIPDSAFFGSVKGYPEGPLGSEEFKAQFGKGLKNPSQLPYGEQVLYYTKANEILRARKSELEGMINAPPGNLTIGNLSNYKPNKTFSLQDTKPLMESLTNITPTSGYAEKMQSMVVNSGNDNSIKQNNETFLNGNMSGDRPNNSGKLLSSRAIGVPGTF